MPEEHVPNSVVPHGDLPPLRWRDLPPPIPLRNMIGPSIILAGLALGSGEFVLWPYITYKTGFVLFWACMLGVVTQYFMNMEITRYSLATGESVITGFCRISKHFAGIFLAFNIIPWMIPAWSEGAAKLTSWLIFGATVSETGQVNAPYVREMSIAGLILCGVILMLGPVIYETIEKIQMFLVAGILIIVAVIAAYLVRWDAIIALTQGLAQFGTIPQHPDLPRDLLLGAIAFAGAGGTMNLGQSNYVKEKGYGMGQYIGRITSPITGKEEPISEIGYHFPSTPENLARWRRWWFNAGCEHFISFFMTCTVCLVLLALISYSIFYEPDGKLGMDSAQYRQFGFIWGEMHYIEEHMGSAFRVLFLLMGIAIFLTTEFGVLDAASRISTDIVKVNWLGESKYWTEGRLYYSFLWGTIACGIAFLMLDISENSLGKFALTSALNGGVMFLYCMLLVYLNGWRLPPAIRMSKWRLVIMIWSVLFFGFFAVMALVDKLWR